MGDPKLSNVFGELDPFGAFVAPELGPGVIGNGLPDPAFMPRREAVRATSSAAPDGGPFDHAPLFGAVLVELEPAAELCGVIVGNEPVGGQVGMASNGEPMPVGGTDPRCVFGIGSGIEFGRTFGIDSVLEFGIKFGIAWN